MGSKSKSSSKSSTTNNNTEYTVSQADYSTGDGTRATTTTSGNNNTVNVTTSDFGAIEGGLKLGADALREGFKFGSDSLAGALDFGKTALDRADAAAERAVKTVSQLSQQQETSNRDTMQKVLAIQEQRVTDGSAQLQKLVIGLALTGAAVAVFVVYMNKKG